MKPDEVFGWPSSISARSRAAAAGAQAAGRAAQAGSKRITSRRRRSCRYLLMAWHVRAARPREGLGAVRARDARGRARRQRRARGSTARWCASSASPASAGAGYDSVARGPGMFIGRAVRPPTASTVAELETALARRDLGTSPSDGVSEEESTRVKAQVIAGDRCSSATPCSTRRCRSARSRWRACPGDQPTCSSTSCGGDAPSQVQEVAQPLFRRRRPHRRGARPAAARCRKPASPPAAEYAMP